MNQQLEPFVDDVRAHYDLSDDFFALFLDPSMTYSCAYFERDDMTLEEAQTAKIDLALGKLDLKPGMTLLDIGCGWGALVKRAVEKYDVNVIGLTLSRNQYDRGRALVADLPTERNVDIRLQGWEEFDEPVDRIVSIGAFEHFRRQRYSAFFSKCRSVLQPGGRMLLHTIVITPPDPASGAGGLTREDAHFSRFILRDIFPGGQLTLVKVVKAKAAEAGFELLREHALGPHYARTLDTWAEKLIASKDEAIALSSEATYDKYVQYLTGSSERFKNSRINVVQFTLEAGDAPAE
ncbi:class I SAM-dependent methyltransferase [Rhodococcus fascians]|nr:class I SAM-dependent methyltransferase [Rhodococcus fascians]MBY3824018.1 class I SAM-dependent methyltransferase [Rhodococcus fascians]MBY3834540.1 class I SAM-dependent methyltransferase [Rhodococcus fascians]MBY3863752.1 class I SAM-dependent methyltransferase [Rhodococcus fascians]MBY3883223.1 class I SAM-dependent methyltransferase [Rhodococcus fascians]